MPHCEVQHSCVVNQPHENTLRFAIGAGVEAACISPRPARRIDFCGRFALERTQPYSTAFCEALKSETLREWRRRRDSRPGCDRIEKHAARS